VDPLISNAVDPALTRVLEKRGEAREAPPRRKPGARRRDGAEPRAEDRPEDGVPEEGVDDTDALEEAAEDGGSGEPKHTLDDLA
jgi:hypothetical protein